MHYQLRDTWQKLKETEREVATVISMYYEPVALNDLARLLNKLDVRTEQQEKFYLSNIRDYINVLTELGITEGVVNGRVQISSEWREPIMRWASSMPGFQYTAEDFRQLVPYKSFWQPFSREAMLREWRLAYYLKNRVRFETLTRELSYFYPKEFQSGFFNDALFRKADLDWLFQQSDYWQEVSLQPAIYKIVQNLESPVDFLAYLDRDKKAVQITSSEVLGLVHRIYVLMGRFDKARELLDREAEDWLRAGRAGELAMLQGQDADALAFFDQARAGYRRRYAKRQGFPDNWAGYLHLLTLLRREGVKGVSTVAHLLGQIDSGNPPRYFQTLQAVIQLLQNDEEEAYQALKRLELAEGSAQERLAWGQAVIWTDYDASVLSLVHLKALYERARANNYRWLAMELAAALCERLPQPDERAEIQTQYELLKVQLGVQPLLNAVPRLERWERALAALQQFTQNNRGRASVSDQRLVWWIDFENKELEAREQTLGKNSQWSKGRKVAPKRIRYGEVDSLTPEDLAVGQAVIEDFDSRNFNSNLIYDFDKAIVALVGHPRLFLLQNPAIGIELVRREPRLLLEAANGGLELRFAHEFDGEGVQIIRETPTRYAVLEIDSEIAQVRRQIGRSLQVPAQARERARAVAQSLGAIVPVQSTLSEDLQGVSTMPGDTTIYVHLLPLGDGFKLEFFVRPRPDYPVYQKPGQGRPRLLLDENGQQQIVERSLEQEVANAEAVITACPTLAGQSGDNYEWPLDEVENCLSALLELQPLREAGSIILEHPKGEKIRLAGQVSLSDLSLVVHGERNWFEVSGELKLDEQRVLDFRDLLQRVASSESNFIQLSNGEYLALTEHLRRRLLEMDSLLSGKELRLHPLAAGIFDEISDELAAFEADIAWRDRLLRLDAAQKISPEIPEGFQAELRPYQLEGYRWLMRLAAWGVGACLADDMGLGKTVQTLAAILARASQGPTLVVAPASVTRNWWRETEKFAPALRPILLGAGDRTEIIDNLGPYDLLLVSYGLLPFEGERLVRQQFATIVLDEAQAIKNRNTKRSRAAMELQGDFRVVTTGTPIENHLGELWNLFNFLNPGLLGSHQRFGEKYAIPISRSGDTQRREQLRRLLQPFILRRRKDDVLRELPPKTEVVLTVELTPEEKSFYEALRQDALQTIEESQGPQKRFQILAQLTRLRQAACHPKLVRPEIELTSSKLELVGETILELLDNGHKALIFSQFVKHLRLVENWVRERNIAYQYLDGQTPGPQRDAAVQAFQRGEGDLFLISLRAGGTGLTLTSADYVLHLDPWWNPAVEDQASDRAHRIGQERPVTVYRFVAENTIEEKIVQLHAEKRDLADSLLAGTEASAALSTDELLALIRTG